MGFLGEKPPPSPLLLDMEDAAQRTGQALDGVSPS